MDDTRKLYLDLMKKALLFQLWDERELPRPARLDPHPFYKRWLVERIVKHLKKSNRMIVEPVTFSESERENGTDWPSLAHTMIGARRLDHLHQCCETVIGEGVPGDLIETGVWRGGACIFMRAVL